MKKIIITIGISNSNKSTWANEQWKLNPHKTVIINRDKIRELLFGFREDQMQEYHQHPDIFKLEKQVTKYEDTLIHEALNENKTVIVDATHLRAEYIERFKFWNVPTEIKWFDVMLKEALTRNMGRTRQVPEEFMKKQYNQYTALRANFVWDYEPTFIELNSKLKPVYLLDIDGTIAHMNGKRSPFDWKSVGVDDVCPALLPAVKMIGSYDNPWTGFQIPQLIVVSGRDSVCRPETIEWLNKHEIDFDDIVMRTEKDMRPDWQVKEEIWRDLATKYNILGLFDDRLQVVRRARSLGLKVFNVEYNNF